MARLADQFLSEEHHIFREQARRFIQDKLVPHVDQWEEEKTFPREVYKWLGEAGLLGVTAPEEMGGGGGDLLYGLIFAEEMCRSGSSGLGAGVGSLGIALPPVIHHGTPEQIEKFVKPCLRGDKIAALGVTEPGVGSDVSAVRTKAVRDGDHYIVNGAKSFITSGTRADFVTTVLRTGGEGFGGISLLVIESDREGFSVAGNMPKMGWHASDTAELVFENVRVPVENRIGSENGGFYLLMENFASERLSLAFMAVEMAQLAFEESLKYVQERRAFGKTLAGHQVTRHKLAEMVAGIDLCRTYNYALASRVIAGDNPMMEVAIAKNKSVDMASEVIDQAVQLHGGYGYMREFLVERLYRDIRLFPIGGGTREVMNEIISKMILPRV